MHKQTDLPEDVSGPLSALMSSSGGLPSMDASAASCAFCASASRMRSRSSCCRLFSLSSSFWRLRLVSRSCARQIGVQLP